MLLRLSIIRGVLATRTPFSVLPTTMAARDFHWSSPRFNSSDPEGTLERLLQNPKVEPIILETLKNLNFKALTKVQDQTIGPAIDSEDGLVVRAKTGTGKTLSFLIPIINDLFPKRHNSIQNKGKVFHLIVVPTRDLALQIEREFLLFCKGHPELKKVFLPRIDVLTGAKRSHLESKFNPSVVVATPGRLLATLRDKKRFGQKFRSLKTLVLDEADRLLDKGFREDLELIDHELKNLNVGKQNDGSQSYKYLLYSATIDENVQDFASEKISQDYKYIDCVDKEDTEAHENINQVLINTSDVNESIHGAFSQCIKGLEESEDYKAIVFLPTIRAVDWFHSTLKRSLGRPLLNKVYKVQGQMTQASRDRNLLGYRKQRGGVLICTDVAARGLDFPDIGTVIQVCPSVETASYIHKIGRTGRAGKAGTAIQFSTVAEQKYIDQLISEKQIEFNQIAQYDTFEQDKKLMNYDTNEETFHEAQRSLLLYYLQVNNTYKLDRFQTFQGVRDFYRTVMESEQELLPIEPRIITLSGLPKHQAEEIFDIPEGFLGFARDNRRGNNKNNKFNRFSNNGSINRGGNSYNRGGNSYNRGGNSYNQGGKSYNRDNRSYGNRDNNRSYNDGRNHRNNFKSNRNLDRNSNRNNRY